MKRILCKFLIFVIVLNSTMLSLVFCAESKQKSMGYATQSTRGERIRSDQLQKYKKLAEEGDGDAAWELGFYYLLYVDEWYSDNAIQYFALGAKYNHIKCLNSLVNACNYRDDDLRQVTYYFQLKELAEKNYKNAKEAFNSIDEDRLDEIMQKIESSKKTNPIQFIKEKRIKWRDERFIDELIETAQLKPEDDFILLEEFHTDFSCGLILLKNRTFYYFDGGEIKQKKLADSVVKVFSKMNLHDTVKNDIGARDKSYYNVFIKNGDTINYALFDDAINIVTENETIEKDRQTVVTILDLLGLGIYYEW